MKTLGEFLFPEIARGCSKAGRRAACTAELVLSLLLFCAAATAAFGMLFAAVQTLSDGTADAAGAVLPI